MARLLVAAMAVLSLATTCEGPLSTLEPIGQGWFLERIPSMQEPGVEARNLVRESAGRRIRVDELVVLHRLYEPDCVVYQTARRYGGLFAVCGGRTPVGIAAWSADTPWELGTDGPSRTLGPEMRSGSPAETIERLPIARVRELAVAQPPFRAGWAATAALDPDSALLQPVTTTRPVDVRATGGEGNLPLLDATRSRNLEVVDALLRTGADVNGKEDGGLTALIIAASNGDLAIVERLLRAGADADRQDRRGRTALMSAADAGQKEIVRRLLTAGASTTLRDAEGKTALERIPASRDIEMRELLSRGTTP